MAVWELLAASPTLFIFVTLLFGLVVGSFLNVVIHRLPLMLEQEWRAQCSALLAQPAPATPTPFNLWLPRSHCPVCGHQIQAAENIPVLSYLLLRGRCAECTAPIPLRYPLVEALGGLLAAVVAWHFGFSGQAAAALAFTWALLALSVIDLREQLLPDAITLPFLWFGMALGLFEVFADLRSSVIGAMAGYLSLWLVYHGFKLLTGKEGMGHGDFKLLAMLGAWLGWQQLPAVVLLSSVVGAVVGSGLILMRVQERQQPIPFGPFLAAAGWITLLWGDALQRAYMSWMGW